MASVKLKKILFKSENMNAMESTLRALGINVAIEDCNKNVIYGSDESSSTYKRHEIILYGEVAGYVLGEEKAGCIAEIIKAMLVSEMEKKQLADETLEKYREINMIYNVSEKIASTVGIGNVGNVIISEVMKYAVSNYASIMLLDESKEELQVICEISKNNKTENTAIHELFNVESETVNHVLSKRSGIIVNHIGELAEFKSKNCMLKSAVISPVAVKGKVIGILLIGSDDVIEYTAADLKLCNSMAQQAGASIEGAKLYDSLRENFFDTVQVLSQIIEMKDSYKNGHYKRVMNYSLNIARAMGMSRVVMVRLKLAVMLHDIGNLSIGDEMLNKKGKFTEGEFEVVKQHSIIGADMLAKIDQLKDIIPIIRSHHERYDGKGYPNGLCGEQIPICARIIAVADAFDAMTNDRPYKASMTLYFAADELAKNKGAQFDPAVVDTFFQIYKDKKLEEIQTYVYNE